MRKSGYTPSNVGLESEINVLLGSDFLWKIQKGIVENFTKELYVVETIFGHTVQGRTDSNKRDVNCLRVSVGNINTQLKSFWNLESLGIIEKNEGNTANLDAVKEFQANLKFVNGRYEARLLWKGSRELLGNNLEVAKVRFSNLENKLLKNNSLFEDYNSILRDQFDQDLFFGANTTEEAFKLSIEAVEIMNKGGMNLRKFETNSEELRAKWNEQDCIDNFNSDNTSLKVLGLIWNSDNDTFSVDFRNLLSKINDNCTKRNVLRIVAMIFDPVGFIAPFVIRMKYFLQQLWIAGLDWDENFSGELQTNWKIWLSEIEDLTQLTISRHYFNSLVITGKTVIQLHVFSDANPNAYGAVAYLRYQTSHDSFKTNFVLAKSRVAPLKKISLPRLELMGALIGARIADYIRNFLLVSNIFYWTDSEIVLHWIKGSNEKWKQFVSNRIAEIHGLSDPNSWGHCESKINPSDLITRGCSAKTLISSKLWWNGPEFLSLPEDQWKSAKKCAKQIDVSDELSRKSTYILSCVLKENDVPIINMAKYSSLTKLYRVTAWIFRFIYNSRVKFEERNREELSADEIKRAEIFWVKTVQRESFHDVIKCLKAKKKIPKESNIFQLNPVLSEEGVLLVRGRLQKSNLTFHGRHPIIIPDKHLFTSLVIKDSYERVLHAGVADTLVQTREKFWILRGRQCVKSVLNICYICKKFNIRPGQQVIAPLPGDRINESPPFSVTGLDFAGPLYVKGSENRHYILLFTCSITRAIHLELVKDMTTAEFLLAFHRFISRRGLCAIIYSDNAKSFKRAEIELKEMWKAIHHPEVKKFYSTLGITWKYIAERAAWWGGFYERMVRPVKTSLRKSIGRSSLTLSELETLLVEVEAMINSRPLTYVYSEFEEPSPLTPAHFLIGKRAMCLPVIKINDLNLPGTKEILLKRLRLRETILNHFWKRWINKYLLNLRQMDEDANAVPGTSNYTSQRITPVRNRKKAATQEEINQILFRSDSEDNLLSNSEVELWLPETQKVSEASEKVTDESEEDTDDEIRSTTTLSVKLAIPNQSRKVLWFAEKDNALKEKIPDFTGKKRVKVQAAVELRKDGSNHYPAKTDRKCAAKCHLHGCLKKTRYICEKWKEPLCPECFAAFHSR
ncbi:uncharacterized protein LOC129226700 [Uloborus diversus]|uniref:uncharacterized protein LOC129226700 n=1 Tax=Uloborus diversus TaxID=327109 RepID=UPI00240A0FCB|nr:uncharacterized protein LOC129226700 [Uloborus diversus]